MLQVSPMTSLFGQTYQIEMFHQKLNGQRVVQTRVDSALSQVHTKIKSASHIDLNRWSCLNHSIFLFNEHASLQNKYSGKVLRIFEDLGKRTLAQD